ncbi:MAG: phenylphosphate carboxylase subunit delta [Proteobacteria bacterium]|nr:phenylphosphate carboxylase subunit delta [Pseudomonadota bacterium]
MPYSHLNDFPADVRERAARVRLAAFDVDGTLTDGRITLDAEGRESKNFHVADGLGLRLLGDFGITVALVTARGGSVVAARARELGIAHVFTEIGDKRACLDALGAQLGIGREAMAFMGDDLPDLQALAAVGLAVAPADAHPWVRERVHWRARLAGGHGAAREVCDLILAARGHADSVLARYLGA